MRLAEVRRDTRRSAASVQPTGLGRLPERLPWRTAAPVIVALSLALWIALLVGIAYIMGLA